MNKKFFSVLLALCLLVSSGCSASPEITTSSSTESSQEKVLDMQALYTQMAEKLPEMLVLDTDMMLSYCGIQETDCLQAVVAINSMNLQVDEVWLLEARDPEALARLQNLAKNRLQVKEAETENYLPDQYAIVKEARVITQGNYLILLVGSQTEALESIYREAIH